MTYSHQRGGKLLSFCRETATYGTAKARELEYRSGSSLYKYDGFVAPSQLVLREEWTQLTDVWRHLSTIFRVFVETELLLSLLTHRFCFGAPFSGFYPPPTAGLIARFHTPRNGKCLTVILWKYHVFCEIVTSHDSHHGWSRWSERIFYIYKRKSESVNDDCVKGVMKNIPVEFCPPPFFTVRKLLCPCTLYRVTVLAAARVFIVAVYFLVLGGWLSIHSTFPRLRLPNLLAFANHQPLLDVHTNSWSGCLRLIDWLMRAWQSICYRCVMNIIVLRQIVSHQYDETVSLVVVLSTVRCHRFFLGSHKGCTGFGNHVIGRRI